MNRLSAATLGTLAFCMLVVGVVRTLPRRLEGVRAVAREQLRSEVASELKTTSDAAAVDGWIDDHSDEYAKRVEARVVELKAALRFTADDGREHAYLGDYDSYLWIHLARNYIRRGTVCDEVVDGVCRETLAHAPVGRESLYARSLHTAAIVGLHRIITVFAPLYPISSTAFFVPVLIGVLGVIPAFFLGLRFGGALVGAVAAALLSALSPALLIRTSGSDNDIWNVVLPLYAVWAAVGSVGADTRRRRVAAAAAAGVVVGLHAATWNGWPFSYALVLLGFGTTLVFVVARAAMQRRHWRVDSDPDVRRVSVAFAAYLCTAAVAVSLVQPEVTFLQANRELLPDSLSRLGAVDKRGAHDDERLWPEEFSSVSELLELRDNRITEFTTNVPLLFVSFFGVALFALGRPPWARPKWGLLGFAAASIGYASFAAPADTVQAGLLIFGPTALAVGAAVVWPQRDADLERGALFIILWLAIAYVFATRVSRFVMFFSPPVGIAVGVVTGWAAAFLTDLLAERVGRRSAAYVAVAAVAAFLAAPLYRGYTAGRDFLPKMNDAWWDTYAAVRDEAPPDAIMQLWWHDGHWAKYVGERPVLADGASLRTHIHYWFRHALLDPDEGRAAGLLRMLGCGSDATPYPEGAAGAYGKLRAQGLSVLAAREVVDRLAGESRAAALQLLTDRGLAAEVVDDVLTSTHCEPPPLYLLLGDDLARTAGWGNGLWDFRRAFVVKHARDLPREEALRRLTADVGYHEAEARQLYRTAEKLRSEAEIRQFIAPALGFLTKTWVGCQADDTRPVNVCLLGNRVAGSKQVLDAVEYSPDLPVGARLRIRATGAAGKPVYSYRTPGTIFVAAADSFRRVHVTGATDPGLAVLIDVPGDRILMAEAVLLGSTFTKLLFLDGRYLERFEPIARRDSRMGGRIVNYRVLP